MAKNNDSLGSEKEVSWTREEGILVTLKPRLKCQYLLQANQMILQGLTPLHKIPEILTQYSVIQLPIGFTYELNLKKKEIKQWNITLRDLFMEFQKKGVLKLKYCEVKIHNAKHFKFEYFPLVPTRKCQICQDCEVFYHITSKNFILNFYKKFGIISTVSHCQLCGNCICEPCSLRLFLTQSYSVKKYHKPIRCCQKFCSLYPFAINQFNLLDDDLLTFLFTFLGPSEFFMVSQVCRRFNNISIKSPTLCRIRANCKIRLYFSGHQTDIQTEKISRLCRRFFHKRLPVECKFVNNRKVVKTIPMLVNRNVKLDMVLSFARTRIPFGYALGLTKIANKLVINYGQIVDNLFVAYASKDGFLRIKIYLKEEVYAVDYTYYGC